MADFTTRLTKAKARSGLTIKELAIWFDGMSDQTMWTWLKGRTPKAYHKPDAERHLGYLEKELAKKKGALPLSLSVRQGERHDHVARIRKQYA